MVKEKEKKKKKKRKKNWKHVYVFITYENMKKKYIEIMVKLRLGMDLKRIFCKEIIILMKYLRIVIPAAR